MASTENPTPTDVTGHTVDATLKAPTCFDKERLWFDKVEHDHDFDRKVQAALVSSGIGENECPTIGEWSAFAVAGGIVTHLTGEQVAIPQGTPEDIERHTWEALWQAVEQNRSILNSDFLGATLRMFLARRHDPGGPARPYFESDFVRRWDWIGYPDAIMNSIGNIRLGRLKEGQELLTQLPPEVANSIREVAPHIPQALKLAVEHVRRTYHW